MTPQEFPGFEGVATTNTRELDGKRETQSRDLLDDISGGPAARDIVDDYIAQVIKSRDVNSEQSLKSRHWKWYEDLAAAWAATLIIRRQS